MLWPHKPHAVAYLDNVIIHSGTWADHLKGGIVRTPSGRADNQALQMSPGSNRGTVPVI